MLKKFLREISIEKIEAWELKNLQRMIWIESPWNMKFESENLIFSLETLISKTCVSKPVKNLSYNDIYV